MGNNNTNIEFIQSDIDSIMYKNGLAMPVGRYFIFGGGGGRTKCGGCEVAIHNCVLALLGS